MIFYFSGTGNSLQAARSIADYNGDILISISERMNSGEQLFSYKLADGEAIGFVFPVYAWGPPMMVLDFIDKLKFQNFNRHYVYAVVTCGENVGNTMKLLGNRFSQKGWQLSSGFSLRMPSNYIIMGNVEKEEIIREKLDMAEETLLDINKVIENREAGVFRVAKGKLPGITTGIVFPLFNKGAISTKKFYADDSCTGCGICEKVCNTRTIKVDKKPQWGDKCTQCLACINLCPAKAIQYGKGTINKGRYKNPNVSLP